MNKHTPAPWVAIYPSDRCFHNGTDITTYEVMTEKTRGELRDEGFKHYKSDPHRVDNITIVSFHYWRDMLDEEAKANADLIAAAPDLLSALQYIEGLAMADDFRDMSTILSMARYAIAKATGEKA